MDLRDTLTLLGFECVEDTDMVEVWKSRTSPHGISVAVRFEDSFRAPTIQWELHTVLIAYVVFAPVNIPSLLDAWGIPR